MIGDNLSLVYHIEPEINDITDTSRFILYIELHREWQCKPVENDNLQQYRWYWYHCRISIYWYKLNILIITSKCACILYMIFLISSSLSGFPANTSKLMYQRFLLLNLKSSFWKFRYCHHALINHYGLLYLSIYVLYKIKCR